MKAVSMADMAFSDPFRNPEYAGYWDFIFERVFGMLIPDGIDVDDERLDKAHELASDITDQCIAEVMAFAQNKSVAELVADVMAQNNPRDLPKEDAAT
jgi:hypothetical protein